LREKEGTERRVNKNDPRETNGLFDRRETVFFGLLTSVPPSTIGLMVSRITSSFSSNSKNPHATALRYDLASMESKPMTRTWNCWYHSSGLSSIRQ
jgi:hypothetical protein